MTTLDKDNLPDQDDELELHAYMLESSEETYRMLLAALDLGWQVEEPVYLRPRWYAGDQWVYHFILKQKPGDLLRLISVRRSQAIESLVSEEGWLIERYPTQQDTATLYTAVVKKGKYVSDLLRFYLPS
jgi:hypothetical protein